MEEKSIPEIGPEQIDAILAFLAIFEQEDYKFGEWVEKSGQVPYLAESKEVLEFHQALYREKMIVVFDWNSWGEETKRYQSDPDVVAEADLLTVRKLLTAHARADRFIEGHFVSVLESGHIIAVLRRLEAIRDEMFGVA
jgi:hypothetical protein